MRDGPDHAGHGHLDATRAMVPFTRLPAPHPGRREPRALPAGRAVQAGRDSEDDDPGHLAPRHSPPWSLTAAWLGRFVHGVEEPLGEAPQLRRGRLRLLLQPPVVLAQVPHLCLQRRLVPLLLGAETARQAPPRFSWGRGQRVRPPPLFSWGRRQRGKAPPPRRGLTSPSLMRFVKGRGLRQVASLLRPLLSADRGHAAHRPLVRPLCSRQTPRRPSCRKAPGRFK